MVNRTRVEGGGYSKHDICYIPISKTRRSVFVEIITIFLRACHEPTLVGRPGVGLGQPGPARPGKFSEGGPRPGPAHQNFRGWATARPSPSITFSKNHGPARPGPSFFQQSRPARPGPSHGSEAHETRALYGPARHFRRPARGFDGPVHGPAHVLSRT